MKYLNIKRLRLTTVKLRLAKRAGKRYLHWQHSWIVSSVILVAVFTILLASYSMLHTAAATAPMIPNGDVTKVWAVPSSGTTHYTLVDDGATANDTDYVSTGTNGTGGEVEEFALDSPSSVASASQIVVTVRLQSIISSTADTVGIALRVNGTLQTVTTVTPTASYADYTATFNGSWSQADVDSMQVYLIRNVLGTGPGSSRDDDVRVSNISASLTYVPSVQYSQSAYRWFSNQDTATQPTFVKAYGDVSAVENSYGMVDTTDGGYAVTGYTTSYGGGGMDMFLSKYDSGGSLTWSRTWGGINDDYGYGIIQTSDGGYAVTGYTATYGNAVSADMFLAKYDSAGNLSWSRVWGGSNSENGLSLIQTSDGGYIVTGGTRTYGVSGSFDVFLVKYDTNGNLSWNTTWGGIGDDTPYDVVQTTDGGYAVTGYTTSYGVGGSNDVFLLKYGADGSVSWGKTWGDLGDDRGLSLIQTTDGGYAVTGYTTSYGVGGSNDVFLLKYGANGSISWGKTWGDTGDDRGLSLVQTSDGGIVATGYTNSYGAGNFDVFLVKYDTNGNLSWNKTWGGTGDDRGYALSRTSDGGYAVAGQTASYGASSTDRLLIKYDSLGGIAGCTTPMCQSPTASSSPTPTGTSLTPSGTSSPAASIGSPAAGVTLPSPVTTVIVDFGGNSVDIGAPLAGQDTAATAPPEGTIFRLRLDIHVSQAQLDPNDATLELRYARKTGLTCDAEPAGNFATVTDTTTIRYADNPNAVNGLPPTPSAANDPKHGTDTNVTQSYQEKGATTFTNPNTISIGQDGMWDFALVANHSIQNTHYCFKVTDGSSNDLNAYTVVPELIIPPAAFTLAAYRWYNPAPLGGSVTFAKSFGDPSPEEYINDIAATPDGGYVGIGKWGSGSYGSFVAKYDSNGSISWCNTLATTTSAYLNGVTVASNGDIVITGTTGLTNNLAFIAKFTSSGTQVSGWGTAITIASDQLYGEKILATSDGGYAITGSTAAEYGDFYIAKFTSAGALSWYQVYGGAGYDRAYTIAEDSSGNLIVGGDTTTYNVNGYNDAFIAKFTSTGTVVWMKTWTTLSFSYFDQINSVTIASDGNYLFGGTLSGVSTVGKVDQSGNVVWAKNIDGRQVKDVVATPDGGLAATGETSLQAGDDMLITKLSSGGSVAWFNTFGTTNTEIGNSIVMAPDSGYVVGGEYNASGLPNGDALLVKYNSAGAIGGCPSSYCGTIQSPATSTPANTYAGQTLGLVSTTFSTQTMSNVYSAGSFPETTIVANAANVGNPFAPQNSPLDMVSISPLSLRVAIAVDASGINANGQAFQLEYAVRNSLTSCSAVPTGSYAPITTTTPIAYYDDPAHASGDGIIGGANDPSDGSRTMVLQSYLESNNFSNSVAPLYAGQDGIWQFPLAIDNATLRGKDFCVRVATAGGTQLTAANVPDVSYGPMMDQLMSHGNWFSRAGIKQNMLL